ncbi:MAG: hypothetical protein DRG71_09990 [Deltaproteobacteria bacterium]|nr:MAG: hypothetical protein DRG71_09990 [Deltaproteobacteria bacterium]
MNVATLPPEKELAKYQISKLQELIIEILDCCEERRLYESKILGVPYAEVKCLMLFKSEKYLTVKGIAQKLDVAKSRVTKIMGGLKNKGLVDTVEDPRDGRVKLICLTPKGSNKVREVEEFRDGIYGKLLLQIKEEERQPLLFYLELLTGAMHTVKSQLD